MSQKTAVFTVSCQFTVYPAIKNGLNSFKIKEAPARHLFSGALAAHGTGTMSAWHPGSMARPANAEKRYRATARLYGVSSQPKYRLIARATRAARHPHQAVRPLLCAVEAILEQAIAMAVFMISGGTGKKPPRSKAPASRVFVVQGPPHQAVGGNHLGAVELIPPQLHAFFGASDGVKHVRCCPTVDSRWLQAGLVTASKRPRRNIRAASRGWRRPNRGSHPCSGLPNAAPELIAGGAALAPSTTVFG